MKRLLFALLVLAWSVTASASSITFLEAVGNATEGMQFYDATAGSIATADDVDSGLLCLEANPGWAGKSGVLADAGREIVFGWQFVSLTGTTARDILSARSSNGSVKKFMLAVVGNATTLRLLDGNGTVLATGTADVKTGTPVLRIALAYTIASTVSNQFRVWVNGVLDINASNVTLLSTGTDRLVIGDDNGSPALTQRFKNGVYVDDGTGLADPGNIKVTAKLPSATNTNNFDTQIGSSTNRYDDVNERPLSESKGWQHGATSDVQENYGLQTTATGDVNLTGATIVGRTAWVWAKSGSPTTQITQVRACSANTTSCAISAPTSGDLILSFAYNASSTTIPTLDGNYTSVSTQAPGGSANAERLARRTSNGAETTCGTWTNATRVACIGLRGVNAASPVGTSVPQNGSSTALLYGGVTLGVTDGTSWVVGFGGAKAATAGMNGTTTALTSNRTNQTTVNGLDTNGGVTSFAQQTLNVTTSGRWLTEAIEVKSNPETPTPKIMDNGSEAAITLTTSSALYAVTTTSASYPSNVAGIGMRSTKTSADTFFYEGGTIIAYIPAVVTQTCVPTLSLLGVGCR